MIMCPLYMSCTVTSSWSGMLAGSPRIAASSWPCWHRACWTTAAGLCRGQRCSQCGRTPRRFAGGWKCKRYMEGQLVEFVLTLEVSQLVLGLVPKIVNHESWYPSKRIDSVLIKKKELIPGHKNQFFYPSNSENNQFTILWSWNRPSPL